MERWYAAIIQSGKVYKYGNIDGFAVNLLISYIIKNKVNFLTPNFLNCHHSMQPGGIPGLHMPYYPTSFNQKCESIWKRFDCICGSWYDIRFSKHLYGEPDYNSLEMDVKIFKKAHKSFLQNWVNNNTAIKTQRSNICAKQGIKIVQDIKPLCCSSKTLNLEFILSNKWMYHMY